MKEKLLSYGFVATNDLHSGDFFVLDISGPNDRFKTRLRWYENVPEEIYVDRFFMRGLETISENIVFDNHNGLYNGAATNYKKFKASFPEIHAV